MRFQQVVVSIISLTASLSLASPLGLEEEESSFAKKDVSWLEQRAPSPSKTSDDILTLSSSTALVNSYIDRIALSGDDSSGAQYIRPFLKKFSNLTRTFNSINDANAAATATPFTLDDKYQLCTQFIYKQRNLISYVGFVSSTFVKNGASKDVKKGINFYDVAVEAFFQEVIPRLDVCQNQLNYGLQDLNTNIDMARDKFS
ncbi:hypothetical protein BGZ63DRAFT_430981 [Mariannaea sp. PMI_226]|nr:hypothetical protein BGZ63DRAFT_430981 [Mariannaea sp. PMI_226]